MSQSSTDIGQYPADLKERNHAHNRAPWWQHMLILVGALALLLVSLGFQTIFFRDYAIIYEGAYRLWLGQQPYQDFGMPMGPMSLIGPWFAFELWLPSWQALLWCQLVLNAVAVIAFAIILIRLGLDFWRLAFAVLTWVMFFAWPNNMPWYNTTALMLELLTLLPLIWILTAKLARPVVPTILAGLLSGIGTCTVILCKQDFGLLTAAMVTILGLVFLQGRLAKSRFVVVFWLALVLCFLLCCWLLPSGFLAQFNYGQGPNATRLQLGRFVHTIMTLDVRIVFIVLIVGGLLLRHNLIGAAMWIIQPQQLTLFLCLSLVLQSLITSTTSGIKVSHYYYWAPLLICLAIVIGYGGEVVWRKRILLLGWALLLLNPVADAYTSYRYPRLSLDWANGWRMGNPLDGNIPRAYIKVEGQLGTQGLYFPSGFGQTLTIVGDLVSEVRAQRYASQKAHAIGNKLAIDHDLVTERPDLDLMLNISELSFLYQDMGVIPPLGVPLWFDDHATFFGPQQIQLANDLRRKRFAIVILQETHSSMVRYIRPALEPNYILRGIGSAPAEGKPIEVWVAKSYHQPKK